MEVARTSSSSEILDNSEKRPTELEGSRDARDKVFKAFRVFKDSEAFHIICHRYFRPGLSTHASPPSPNESPITKVTPDVGENIWREHPSKQDSHGPELDGQAVAVINP
ncbi:hypothetical protein WH47_02968 [Habropoda laboriosa]|uniref:Uncharacterized protein n=1 Tax=Habropoda laboriosa TaxID=597456 RepID=A0A0L7QTA2_9HYME|nr:hypothetical protein WH47_02968 [Habropoda laboriosa]